MQGSSSGEQLPTWALNLTILTEYINTLLPEERDVLFERLGIKSVHDLESLFQAQNKMHVEPYELQLMNITEYWLSKHLRLIVPPILIVIGTIGNILSCIILLRRQMARISTYIYLGALAIVDTCVLYMGLFRIWLGEIARFDIMGKHDAICKIFMLLGYTASDFSVWIIVAVTFERYIAVCFPLQASSLCNPKRAILVILSLLAVILTVNLHFLWTVKVIEYEEFGENVRRCKGGEQYEDFIRIWPWVDAFIYSFLPFILIMSLNFLIIRQVFVAHRDRTQFLSNDPRRQSSQDTGYKITVMLLTISFAFLLTTLPMVICMIIGAILQSERDFMIISQVTLAGTITEYLMYVNHSMNFFLYCATGQKFRQQLSRLACWKTGQNQYSRSQMVSESVTANGGTYTYRYRNADQTEMLDINNRTGTGKQYMINRPVT